MQPVDQDGAFRQTVGTAVEVDSDTAVLEEQFEGYVIICMRRKRSLDAAYKRDKRHARLFLLDDGFRVTFVEH